MNHNAIVPNYDPIEKEDGQADVHCVDCDEYVGTDPERVQCCECEKEDLRVIIMMQKEEINKLRKEKK